MAGSYLLQALRLERDAFPCRFLLPILPHPTLPAFARCHVSAGKGERCNVGIGNRKPVTASLGQQAHKRIGERFSLSPIKNITFECGAVFARNRDVAPIIESLLQCSM